MEVYNELNFIIFSKCIAFGVLAIFYAFSFGSSNELKSIAERTNSEYIKSNVAIMNEGNASLILIPDKLGKYVDQILFIQGGVLSSSDGMTYSEIVYNPHALIYSNNDNVILVKLKEYEIGDTLQNLIDENEVLTAVGIGERILGQKNKILMNKYNIEKKLRVELKKISHFDMAGGCGCGGGAGATSCSCSTKNNGGCSVSCGPGYYACCNGGTWRSVSCVCVSKGGAEK